MKRLSLSKQFLLISMLVALTVIGIGCWVAWQIERGVMRQTTSAAALYASSIISPHLQRLDSADALTADDTTALKALLGVGPMAQEVVTTKVWNPHGRILYSTDSVIVGRSFPIDEPLAAAWRGTTTSRVSKLDEEENVNERLLANRLVETYTPVYLAGTDHVIAVVEFYSKAGLIVMQTNRVETLTQLLLGGAALGWLYLLVQNLLRRTPGLAAIEAGHL